MPNNISSLEKAAKQLIKSNPDLPALVDDIYKQLDLDGLTHRQRLFVLRFDGRRPSQVAADAGYQKPEAAAIRLMSNEKIANNVHIISKALEKAMVASSLEVLLFWSKVMNDDLSQDGFNARDRLWASERLAKFHRVLEEPTLNINADNRKIFNVLIAAHTPANAEEAAEIERLEKVIDVQTSGELAAMGKIDIKREDSSWALSSRVTLEDIM